jgi:diketogulonate reductase-like aldo/keto reductase
MELRVRIIQTTQIQCTLRTDRLPVYKTEPELGLAIKESAVDRSKLFVTTKVMGNIGDPEAALKTSLKKLQLDYVDLYGYSPAISKYI